MKKLERNAWLVRWRGAWISSTWLVSFVLFIIKTPCPYRAREAVGNTEVGEGCRDDDGRNFRAIHE